MTDGTAPVDNSNLFVGNVSWNLTQDDVRDLFAPFGELEDVRLITDRETWRSKWIAFVKFVDEEDAQKAIEELNEKEIDGRPLKVDVAKPRVPRPEREQY